MPFLHCLFRVNQIPVDFELKSPPAAGDKRETFNDVLVMAEDVIRHTDGAFAVVSRNAVFEGDCVFLFHNGLSITAVQMLDNAPGLS